VVHMTLACEGTYLDPEPTVAGFGGTESAEEVPPSLKGCLVAAAARSEVPWPWSKWSCLWVEVVVPSIPTEAAAIEERLTKEGVDQAAKDAWELCQKDPL